MGLFGGSLVLENVVSRVPSSIDNSTEQLVDVTQDIVKSANTLQATQTLGQQLMVAGITILGGFVVYVAGQIFIKFIIEPIHEQKRTIGEIADAIIFYANKYYSAPLGLLSSEVRYEKEVDRNEIISDRIRGLGTQLVSKTHLIPLYNLFSLVGIVKPMKEIVKAKKALMGLSNLAGSPDREAQIKFEKEIRSSLGIFDPE